MSPGAREDDFEALVRGIEIDTGIYQILSGNPYMTPIAQLPRSAYPALAPHMKACQCEGCGAGAVTAVPCSYCGRINGPA